MEELRVRKAFICDMDGVIYHGKPCVARSVRFCELVETRESVSVLDEQQCEDTRATPRKMRRLGLDLEEDHF